MTLDLSRVTLLFVETRAHDITKIVIDDCLTKAKFGDVLIYTNAPARIPVHGARYRHVPDFPNKVEAGRFYYSAAMAHVETDFALMMEWDAGIHDPAKWVPEFFNYDYIGAPWWPSPRPKPEFDVGNGGFTLMSKRLGQFLCDNTQNFPVCTDIDICRNSRLALEQAGGFKWADYGLASRFSWELGPRNPENFGYHAVYTWPTMLGREETVRRARIMAESPYLLTKMFELVNRGQATWLEQELGPELWAKYLAVAPPSRRNRMFTEQQRQNMLRTIDMRRALYESQRTSGLKA